MPRIRLVPFVTVALAATIGTALPAQSRGGARPDLILTHGKIFTADTTRPWAEALAVRGGRVLAVGSSAEIARLAGRTTRRIDLGGRTVVPGFNDAHDHVGGSEFGVPFLTSDSPTPDPSLTQVADSVAVLARRVPRGTWLRTEIGMRIVEDAASVRAALDRVAPEHPVLLHAPWGHATIVNGAGLSALGIRDSARDPLGGFLERDGAGRLTGALQEYAAWEPIRRLSSALPDSTLVRAVRRYAAEGAALGITSVQDMAGYLEPAKTVRVFRAARPSMRVRLIRWPIPDAATGWRTREWDVVPERVGPNVVVSGRKWVLDGSPIERLARQRMPYADRAGWSGWLDFPADTVRGMLARALATHEPLHLHVAGDSTARMVFGLMQALAPDSVWRPLRVRIEHGDWVSGDLVPVARRLGVVVVQNPSHFAFEPGMLEARLGGRPAGFQAVRSLVEAGVPVALGSDGPRSPGLNLMFAVVHPNNPAQALTREQAVTAYTRGSAYAEFAERDKGMLAPGMLADLAVLSQDVFTVPAQALPATVSLFTLVGGTVVHDALSSARRGAATGPGCTPARARAAGCRRAASAAGRSSPS